MILRMAWHKDSFYPATAHANGRTCPGFCDPLPVFLDLLSGFIFCVGKSCMQKCNYNEVYKFNMQYICVCVFKRKLMFPTGCRGCSLWRHCWWQGGCSTLNAFIYIPTFPLAKTIPSGYLGENILWRIGRKRIQKNPFSLFFKLHRNIKLHFDLIYLRSFCFTLLCN